MHPVVILAPALAQTVARTAEVDDGRVGPLAVENDGMLQAGPYAFIFFLALGLSLVFLLFSMRKQMRRVDFDQSGRTDAERMRQPSPSATPDDDGT